MPEVSEHIRAVHAAAVREQRAALARDTADATWRATWWATTALLGESGKPRSPGFDEAVSTVCRDTGQARTYVTRRAACGRAFRAAAAARKAKLSPTYAMEWINTLGRASVASEDDVSMILAAEANDDVSKRSFARELGNTQLSYEPGYDQRATAKQIVRAAQHSPDVLREAMETPEVVRQVAEVVSDNPITRRTFDDARNRGARRRLADAGIHLRKDPEAETVPGYASAMSLLDGARDALNQARRGLADAALDDGLRGDLLDSAMTVERALTAFRQTVSGDIDRELIALLENGGAA